MPNRTRNNKIIFRLNDDELKAFKSRLEASRMTQEAFLRSLCLGQAITVVEGLPEAYKELRAIGNNINQLARAVNSGKSNAREETDELVKEVRKVWLSLKALGAQEKE